MAQSRRQLFRYIIPAALLGCLTCYLLLWEPETLIFKTEPIEDLSKHTLPPSESQEPLRDLLSKSNLHSLRNADEFLPYFSLLPSLASLTAGEAIGNCEYTEQEKSVLQFELNAYINRGPRTEPEFAKIRSEWQSFIQHKLIPWSNVSHRFQGAGIVALAGPHDQLMRLKTMLRVLRLQHNTVVPVEISFFGDELNEQAKAELVEIYGDNIFFNDLSHPDQVWPTFLNKGLNYQLKTAALVNSRFQEMLLLDSDNIPVVDPAELFYSHAYGTYGSVFWPDLKRTFPEHPAWAMSNTRCRREEYEFETGQVLVDKARLWHHLQLAAWLHTQPDWQEVILGDKDMFRYAWHALRTKFGTPVKWVTSIGFLVEQRNFVNNEEQVYTKYCGHSFAQHLPDHSTLLGHPGSGIAFMHGGVLKTIGAPMAARLRALKGGVFTHYKRVPIDVLEDWNKVQHRVDGYILDSGWYLNYTEDVAPSNLVSADEDFDLDGIPIGEEGLQRLELTDKDRHSAAWCIDIDGVEPKPIADLGWEISGLDMLFKNAGGFWMIEEGRRW